MSKAPRTIRVALLREVVVMAFDTVRTNKMRSGLTVLGVYRSALLLAVAVPPRQWDMPHQWRAIGVDGRAVEVNGPIEARRRALRYAELLAPSATDQWVKGAGW